MKPDVTTTVQVLIAVRGKRRQCCGGECRHRSRFAPICCELFDDDNGPGVWLDRDAKGRCLRCPQCLAAEVPE